jgi:hypothetical protein
MKLVQQWGSLANPEEMSTSSVWRFNKDAAQASLAVWSHEAPK